MLMLSPFAKADMDNVCIMNVKKEVDVQDFIFEYMDDAIDDAGCERNNILLLTLPYESQASNLDIELRNSMLMYASALWCRHDRNEKVEGDQLRCVLYDTKPRKFLF